MSKRLTYIEIPADDAGRAARFYETVLGWKVELRPGGDPRFEDAEAHLIGRWVTGRPIARELSMLPYFYVDRVADSASLAAPNCGEVLTAPYREGDLWVARLRDPAGNAIGIWQFAEPS
jgi:predicted enzyme related to lactoylglutathione lyase